MKSHYVPVNDITDWNNLCLAARKAALGKRNRPEVVRFFNTYEASLDKVGMALQQGRLPHGKYRAFKIHDPKPRVIHAALFPDRVAHHALMAPMEKPLDDWQLATSFACRKGKGSHAAALYAQRQCRRFDWYLKMDVAGYFEHIQHKPLLNLLRRRLRGEKLFGLIQAVLSSYHTGAACGLPIGSLTSQYFANIYLTPADKWLLDQPAVKAHCRYMDDTVVWIRTRKEARDLFQAYSAWLQDEWGLTLKPSIIQKTCFGLTFCGYRIHRESIRPGRRRMRIFSQRLLFWQDQFIKGKLSSVELQQRADALIAMLQPSDSSQWRRRLINAPASRFICDA